MSWAQLGEQMFGGGDAAVQGAYESRTNDLARADLAMNQARIKRDEAMARERLRAMSPEMLLGDSAIGDLMLSGVGGNYQQVTAGRGNVQQQGFRDTIANPELHGDVRFGAGLAIDPSLKRMESFGAHTYGDRFGGGDPMTTPLGDAFISSTNALEQQRLTDIPTRDALRDAQTDAASELARSRGERTDNPERYRSPSQVRDPIQAATTLFRNNQVRDLANQFYDDEEAFTAGVEELYGQSIDSQPAAVAPQPQPFQPSQMPPEVRAQVLEFGQMEPDVSLRIILEDARKAMAPFSEGGLNRNQDEVLEQLRYILSLTHPTLNFDEILSGQ